MENASKALIMAASVLLGLMIISVGVALFRSFSGSGAKIMEDIERSRVQAFNNEFFKYSDYKDGLNAHDIVSIANLASKNNREYEVENESNYGDKSFYIRVDVKNTSNFEKKDNEFLIKFIKDNYNSFNGTPVYYYISQINVSKITGRVNYIKIQQK